MGHSHSPSNNRAQKTVPHLPLALAGGLQQLPGLSSIEDKGLVTDDSFPSFQSDCRSPASGRLQEEVQALGLCCTAMVSLSCNVAAVSAVGCSG